MRIAITGILVTIIISGVTFLDRNDHIFPTTKIILETIKAIREIF